MKGAPGRPRVFRHGRHIWTKSEEAKLKYYAGHANREKFEALFPFCTWNAIKQHAQKALGLKLTQGTYTLKGLARETGYNWSQIEKARAALGQNWKAMQTGKRGSGAKWGSRYMITEAQYLQLMAYFRGEITEGGDARTRTTGDEGSD